LFDPRPFHCASGPASSLPSATLELAVRCENLTDRDLLSKSDPFCVAFLKKNGAWIESDRTETLANNLNPAWLKKFSVRYSFEESQPIKFEVYDADTRSGALGRHDFLGRCETTLAALVSAGAKFVSVLKDGPRNNGGRIVVFAEEKKESADVLTLRLSAQKLDKKDLFGKCDPFFVLSRQHGSGGFAPVYQSEVVKNTLSPTWKSLARPVAELCNADRDRKLRVDVYDWDGDGSRELVGSFEASLDQLRARHLDKGSFACVHPDKAKKSSYKNSGLVFVDVFDVERPDTFLDYVRGGLSVHFSVGVDFTASNGDPRDPASLHHFGPSGDTHYTLAIKAVGQVIQDYDADRMYPALGFGARLPPRGDVSHCFFLNLRSDNPFCVGVGGLLEAYRTALGAVSLYGPTHFSPLIEHVATFAKTYADGGHYFVLLILTDGVINDLEATKKSIVEASALPLSIVVVGVGDEDFSAMVALDADKEPLRAGHRTACRDVVQFVELRRFLRQGVWDKETLAREVLREVPAQVVQWMKMKNIKPAVPPS